MNKIQFTGYNHAACLSFIGDKFSNKMGCGPNIIDKDGNVVPVEKGDWIVKDLEGNLSVKSEIQKEND